MTTYVRLKQYEGQTVTLILSSGEKITGTILEVDVSSPIPGDFEELTIEERLYEPEERALTYVRISHISAIATRVKKD